MKPHPFFVHWNLVKQRKLSLPVFSAGVNSTGPTKGGGGKTIIGNNCLFMISSHVAHDCKIGNNVVIANNVPLGGHIVGNSVTNDSVIRGEIFEPAPAALLATSF